MISVTRVAVLLAGLSLYTRMVRAQQTTSGSAGHDLVNGARNSTIRAAPIQMAMPLDGRLDKTFWATADSIDDFRQRAVGGTHGSEILS